MKRKWSKIRRGDVVDLNGRDWVVEKIKPKGKRLRVAVRSGQHTADSVVDPDEKVRIAEAPPVAPRTASAKRKPAPTTPPKPAVGDPWETQQDRIEKRLDEILSARLVGEATDADAGYYVPPVDISTIAAHLAIFHGGIPEDTDGEQAMLATHERQHELALVGSPLAVNHWHTEKRPTKGKKGKR